VLLLQSDLIHQRGIFKSALAYTGKAK